MKENSSIKEQVLHPEQTGKAAASAKARDVAKDEADN